MFQTTSVPETDVLRQVLDLLYNTTDELAHLSIHTIYDNLFHAVLNTSEFIHSAWILDNELSDAWLSCAINRLESLIDSFYSAMSVMDESFKDSGVEHHERIEYFLCEAWNSFVLTHDSEQQAPALTQAGKLDYMQTSTFQAWAIENEENALSEGAESWGLSPEQLEAQLHNADDFEHPFDEMDGQ